MKTVFVHDHQFKLIDGIYYSGGSFPDYVWKRYLQYTDEIIVVGRELKADIKGMVTSSTPGVCFHLLDFVISQKDFFTKKSQIEQFLASEITKADNVIIRLPSTFGLYAVELCKKLHKSYAIEVVGCVWDSLWNYGGVSAKALALVFFPLHKRAIRSAPFAIYVTKKYLQQKYPCTGITKGVSDVEIRNLSPEVLSQRIAHIKERPTKINIGLIGNMGVSYKGHDIAIKALQLLRARGMDVVLHFIGAGENPGIQTLATRLKLEPFVVFHGRVQSGEPVFRLLDEFDLYIQPSRQEGLPRALVEAMSRACPALASDLAGIPELLEQKYLHQAGDFKKLAADIQEVMDSEKKLITMAKENFEKAREYLAEKLDKERSEFWQSFFDK